MLKIKNKKILNNTILQFSIVFIILGLFFFEKLDYKKLEFLFSIETCLIILFYLFSILLISIFFSFILVLLSKKDNYYKIIKIYLQGALANQAIPGLGYVYRYLKYNNELQITFTQYSSAQLLNNFFILFSYILIALILGFLKINFNFNWSFFFMIFLLLVIIFFMIYKYNYKIFYHKKLKKIYYESSNIKKIFLKNYFKFSLIFFFYFLQSFFQCYVFYRAIKMLDFNLDFITTSYLYISSIILSFLSIINFIGIFELVLSFAASFFLNDYMDMWFAGLGYRIIGISSILIAIMIFYIIDFLDGRKF